MAEEDQWLDEEAGPVVRPYALTRGRTRPTGETLDLIALVTAIRGVEVDPVGLDPEHLALLRCAGCPPRWPTSPPIWTCPWAWSRSCWPTCGSGRSSASTTRSRPPNCPTREY